MAFKAMLNAPDVGGVRAGRAALVRWGEKSEAAHERSREEKCWEEYCNFQI